LAIPLYRNELGLGAAFSLKRFDFMPNYGFYGIARRKLPTAEKVLEIQELIKAKPRA
jgi:hypothetical protein